MNRRELLQGLMAGGIVVAGELWMPGKKLISIPKTTGLSRKWLVTPIGEPPNTTSFTVAGLGSGDVVYLTRENYPLIRSVRVGERKYAKFTVPYSYDKEYRVRVRNGGITPIKPFEVTTMIDARGLSLQAIRIPDA
jgi:hypothetical protein